MMDRLERRIYAGALLKEAREYVASAAVLRQLGHRQEAVCCLIGAGNLRKSAINLLLIERLVATGVLPPSVIGE